MNEGPLDLSKLFIRPLNQELTEFKIEYKDNEEEC